jgi:hypothetical protein
MKPKDQKRKEALRRMLETWKSPDKMPLSVLIDYVNTLKNLPTNDWSEFPLSGNPFFHPSRYQTK